MIEKVMILGATGLLGRNLVQSCIKRKIKFITVGRKNCHINLDLSEPANLKNLSKEIDRSIVINATGYTSLEKCEKDFKNCYQINTRIVENFFKHSFCESFKFVQISTDQLYEGKKNFPNKETDKIKIINKYAKSKYEAEKICYGKDNSLIIRTNFTGIKNNKKETFFEWVLDKINSENETVLFNDMYCSTLDVNSTADLILDLSIQNAVGVYNLGSEDFISKKEFFLKVATEMKKKYLNIREESVDTMKVKRNKNIGLDISKTKKLLNKNLPNSKEVIKKLIKEINAYK